MALSPTSDSRCLFSLPTIQLGYAFHAPERCAQHEKLELWLAHEPQGGLATGSLLETSG